MFTKEEQDAALRRMKEKISDSELQRIWQPSGRLRWAKRRPPEPEHKELRISFEPSYEILVLQQEWINRLGEREWRDIPIETEED